MLTPSNLPLKPPERLYGFPRIKIVRVRLSDEYNTINWSTKHQPIKHVNIGHNMITQLRTLINQYYLYTNTYSILTVVYLLLSVDL